MDKLEEYILKHREEMDRYKPSSGIRRKIMSGLRTGTYHGWISVAALIAVILGTAVVLLKPGLRSPDNTPATTTNQLPVSNNAQLRETEIYYNNLANTLYREASPMLTKNPEIQKELVADISQIDSICSEIKKDLKDNIDNQNVIEALIQNYRLKIDILEDMLKILKENEGKPEKKENHEL